VTHQQSKDPKAAIVTGRTSTTALRLVIPAVVVVLGIAVTLTASALVGDRDAAISEPVPSREFVMFDGSRASLADWRGRPVVLNFWASWCPPCVAEMRDAFGPAHQDFGDEVVFIGMNLQDDRDAAVTTVDQTGVTYELAEDPDGDLFADVGGFGMPTTVFISAEGEIVGEHTGALDRATLDRRIEELL